MLKGQFGSSKELRLAISDALSSAHACQWISTCIVLHNFLIVERLANHAVADVIWDNVEEDEPTASAERAAEFDSVAGQRRTSLFAEFLIEKGY